MRRSVATKPRHFSLSEPQHAAGSIAPAFPAIGRGFLRLLWLVVGVVVVLSPLLVDPFGKDIFRLPKELLFRSQAVIILATAAIAAVFGRFHQGRAVLRDRIVLLSVSILGWTLVVTLCSTNLLLSFSSVLWVIAGVVFTLTVYIISASVNLRRVDLLFVAAIPNCCIYLLQDLRFWNPFATEEYIVQSHVNRHLFSTAFVGNPDDLASYLLVPALASVVLTRITSRRGARVGYLILSVVIGVTLVASQSWAAIGAFVVGLAILIIMTTRRPMIPIVVMLIAFTTVAVSYAPFRSRLVKVVNAMRGKEFGAYSLDLILSNRLVPFVSAAQMARDHPITGVGPHAFSWQYYPYKVMFDNAHLDLKTSSAAWWSFGEVHSDHLQTLAVAGVPGYLLFCASIALLASGSRGIRSAIRHGRLPDDRRSFALLLSLPLAASFAVLTLALFPLELAAPTVVMLYASALCASWRPSAEKRR